MRTVIVGTDMLMKLGAEPLLRQGLISVEQYAEVSRRNALLSKQMRNTEVIL
jgi:hypothetical protein